LKEFSLENIAENIHFGKTKVYFTEVLSSYHNCNYRSSVVMLWSVSVCDIIYKLQYLVDLYADSAAKEILDEITSLILKCTTT
jgi:L-ribulose-5-phosphate 3-epimerase UlaE